MRLPNETRPTEPGDELDYRFSLANERTFLAWIRTALALVGGGLAVDQLLPELGRPTALRVSIATVLLVLGAATAVHAAFRWVRVEKQMRSGHELPSSSYPRVLAVVVALGAALLLVVVLLGIDR
ncbi:YidH family protein [Cryptosporangium sp. NPDC048952]|uniref:YidH family protein n=1 Tax=Cryptosporangium sp. NPDC048952 TaxID=3363961 RepID=UPI0037199587